MTLEYSTDSEDMRIFSGYSKRRVTDTPIMITFVFYVFLFIFGERRDVDYRERFPIIKTKKFYIDIYIL